MENGIAKDPGAAGQPGIQNAPISWHAPLHVISALKADAHCKGYWPLHWHLMTGYECLVNAIPALM